MKFKNFQNSYTSDNRIYSNEELYNMPLNKLVSMEKELGAQYGSIGFPMESELRQSENVVYVHAYTRDDGTNVKSHWRSKPTNLPVEKSHWRSKPDNSKNEGVVTGGASEPEIKQKDINNNKNDKIYVNQEKLRELGEEKYKALYPDEIAGVKRGKEMSFEEAGGNNVNPNFQSGEEGYKRNCQTCVICFEARKRGYDVEALPYGSEESKFLSYYPNYAFIDTKTKMVPRFNIIEAYNSKDLLDWLNKNIQRNERYMFRCIIKIDNIDTNNQLSIAHTIILTKFDSDSLVFYDAMSGISYDKNFVNKIEFKGNRGYGMEPYRPSIIRIDNKQLNPNFTNKVLMAKKNKN